MIALSHRLHNKKSGIYCVIFKQDSKLYIGSSKNVYERCCRHKTKLRQNIHDNKYLQNYWNLFGENEFDFMILELCDEKNLLDREEYWFEHYKSYDRKFGFNFDCKPRRSAGWKHSSDSLKKMSGPRPRISGKNNPMYGKKHSNLTKRKISEGVRKSSRTFRKFSDEEIKLFSVNNPKRKLTDIQIVEIKNKLSNGCKRKVIAQEYNISVSHVGLIHRGGVWGDI